MKDWDAILEKLSVIWNFNIITIDQRTLAVGNIILAISLFVFGLMFAKFLSHWLRRKVLHRLRMEGGAADSLQALIYYALIVLLTFWALSMANIPLTVFAALGGAIAIGFGFGSQTVIKNFISGIIILFERPIKVSDLIEVDGTYGRVIQIGVRRTHVRTGDNIDILIPNSSFLEKNVVNWTLSTAQIRTCVKVGVAYGSPVEKVKQLLLRAVKEHKEILSDPKPIVIFREFGDSSLNFEVFFWIYIADQTTRLIIESDIRTAIDQIFKESGVVIAFPQRDLHVEVRAPFEVKMV